MAGASQRSETKLSLEIRTKSVEQTLVPLVTQITTLVNHKERCVKSEKTLRALTRVGEAVNMAVERFVTVGEKIAEENPEIANDMCEACKEARIAGQTIQKLTDATVAEPQAAKSVGEKTAMVRAARQLLSAITKVLLLADRVIVKQLLATKDKVSQTLSKIEMVNNFPDFVKSFSQFGKEMVELAHFTGDRQNDLKSDKQRAQMGAARAVLEKSTMMLLTSCKTLMRHPECPSAKANRESVFLHMRRALDTIHHVVTDGINLDGESPTPAANGDSGISLAQHQPTASKALKEFDDLVEMTRVTLVGPNTEGRLQSALETMIETTQDFTDSAYTSHENRERILILCERVRQELGTLLRVGLSLDQKDNTTPNRDLETAILKTRDASKTLRKQLQDTAMDQASDVFKSNEDGELITALKAAGLAGQKERVDELSVKFEEHSEQVQEVCKLLRHVAVTDPLIAWCEHTEQNLKMLGPEVIHASQTLASHETSKIAKENFEVFTETWASQINDLSVLVKDVNDVCQGKSSEKQVYLSLPRPGKHGTTARQMKPVKLSAEEQAKIAKLGLEMKLITSEMDAEADKWEEPDNEIVRRVKNMSSMAFSMYLFTRGEGPLKTTQDLFTQAEYFAEEGAKLFKTVKDFSQIVPAGGPKNDLLGHLDRLPILCQQLNFTLKSPTVGKAATFNKVDGVIQETKNLMNAVAKVVTTCFICATKYNLDYRGSGQPVKMWRPGASSYDLNGGAVGGTGSDGSDRESVKSSRSGRSDPLIRSSSLNRSMGMGTYNYDRL